MTGDAKDDSRIGHRSRLRERFLAGGSKSVAEYELLEMILFAASSRGDTKPLAKALIKHFGSFAKVIQASPQELEKVKGVGDAIIAAIKVIQAAAETLLKQDASEGTIIQSWTSLLDYCRVSMAHRKTEEFRVLFLDHKNNLLADELQQSGTVNHAPVYPRELVKRALDLGASALIMVHNHPSGDPTPSKDDIDITKRVATAATSLGLQLHDHLIIAKSKHFSFKSNGLI